jgi:pSer/pThr/pTyr-binding forkhead associated (FHA) protein
MANFRTCINGHNYDIDVYTVCPFCPSNSLTTDYEKTLTDFKKTKILESENQSSFDKTIINEEISDLKTTHMGKTNSKQNFGRTQIVSQSDSNNISNFDQSIKRKIVGWLVTFTYEETGQDYRLYIGKNKIGSLSSNDIIINDPSISGEHVTILFRDNEFLIKDNFSTNGTKINGITTDEGKLKEGDELRLGNAIFKFKTVF